VENGYRTVYANQLSSCAYSSIITLNIKLYLLYFSDYTNCNKIDTLKKRGLERLYYNLWTLYLIITKGLISAKCKKSWYTRPIQNQCYFSDIIN